MPRGWGFFFLNTDGSVRFEDDSATARVVVRNRNGEWIIGYYKFWKVVQCLKLNRGALWMF